MTTRGHCLCKKTRWEFDGDASWVCYCHCNDCRRNCSAPVVVWLGVLSENFKWLGEKPKTLESSKGVFRHFCKHCGTPMGFEADHYEGSMNLYVASSENPQDFIPTFHLNYQSRLPWFTIDDDLPKYEGTLLNTSDDKKSDFDDKNNGA